MNKLFMSFVQDESGQDLIEYALLAGAVALSATALLPGPYRGASAIVSRVGSVLEAANGEPSQQPPVAITRPRRFPATPERELKRLDLEEERSR